MKKIIWLFCSILFITSCDRSMDEINTNPDKPTSVTPSLLSNRVILQLTDTVTGKNFLAKSWAMKQSITTEIMNGYQYNSFTDSESMFYYTQLTNSQKMMDAVNSDKSMAVKKANSYKALDLFATAFFIHKITMQLGDIPFSERLGAESGHLRPKYDTQEDVFYGIITSLDEAAKLFGDGATFDGDPIFSGSTSAWVKTTNSFLLVVLNQLSKKETVKGINIKSKFEEVAKRSLMESDADNFAKTYHDIDKQYYPFYYKSQNYTQYMYMTDYFTKILKKYADYRVFYYMEPAIKEIQNGVAESNFDAYEGIDGTKSFSETQKDAVTEKYSLLNIRYSKDPVNEPVKTISYDNIQFVLAEAALRGWLTPASAETHYNNAVRASMNFTAKYTKDIYRHGVTIDDAYIDNYLNGVANLSRSTNKLETILEQKYIASFLQNDWDVYYDYRRTGYPVLIINPNTSLNQYKKDAMPLRWLYPSSEYNSNKDNLLQALNRQFGSDAETINDAMWLLK